jgi:hypothetical protein
MTVSRRDVIVLIAMKKLAIIAAVVVGLFSVLRAQQRETFAWAPLPVQPNTWVAPNQPIWKLSELLAKHKGQPNWGNNLLGNSWRGPAAIC